MKDLLIRLLKALTALVGVDRANEARIAELTAEIADCKAQLANSIVLDADLHAAIDDAVTATSLATPAPADPNAGTTAVDPPAAAPAGDPPAADASATDATNP